MKIILVLLFVFPLAVLPPATMFSEAMPRASLLLTACAFLLYEPDGWRHSALLRSATGRLFLAVLGCQAIVLILSTIFAVDPGLASFGTGWRRLGLLSQLAILVLTLNVANLVARAPGRVVLILRVVTAAGLLAALHGIAQYFGWDPLLHADRVRFSGTFRPPGTFGNPTYFANYLIFPILTGLGLGMERGPASWRCALWRGMGWVTAGAASFALLLTGTRSGVASLVIGVLIFVCHLRPRLNRWHATGVVIFALVVDLFVGSSGAAKLVDRMGQWLHDPGGPRMLIYRDSLRMAQAHLLLGTGADSFEAVFPRYQSRELARAYPDFFEESPHNVCLEYLTAQGLPGALCFLALSGLGIAAAAGMPRTVPSALALASLTAGFITHQVTIFILPTALLYFVFIGCAVGMAAGPSEATAGERHTKSWIDSCLLPIAALFLVIAFQWFYSEFQWREVKRNLDNKNIAAALRGYEALQSVRPGVPGLDLWFSQQLAAWLSGTKATDRPPEVSAVMSQTAKRACRSSADRQNAFYNLGLVNILRSDVTGAEQAFRSASEQAPHWYKPHLVLAEILFQTGRADLAEAEALQAVALSGGTHPETLRTLEAIRAGRSSGR